MYIVNLINGAIATEVHGEKEKLKSGTVVKGINSIDSFSFTILPDNAGFGEIHDFTTLVSVYNTNKNRYEFRGRVLYSQSNMDEDGLIYKEVVCESYFGFLCDSKQPYVDVQNWTVTGLLQHIIDAHNAQLEPYKHFTIGEVTVTDPNDNLYIGIQRDNTWKTIEDKLIKILGGEIRFRVEDGITYIDYLTQIGETRATKIALSRNMKSIMRETDPTAYITRLIPLGAKVKDAEGNDTEERLDITSVNNGLNYIEDEAAVAKYGIHVEYVYFDDVNSASTLLSKGEAYLVENNRVKVKYSITALDLSLLGLEIDDIEVHDSYPIENSLLLIDDTARVIKKTIDVVEGDHKSKIEIGDTFKTLSEIQREQAGKVESLVNKVGTIEGNYVTNVALKSESQNLISLINQTTDSIVLSVEDLYTKKTETEELRQAIAAELTVLSDEIIMKFNTTSEQISNVDGDLQSKYAEIKEYIRFSGGSITLGSNQSAITLTIDNDRIVFKRNGVEFGSWDGDNFFADNIWIRLGKHFRYGNFKDIPREDGSVITVWVGD